MQKILLITLAAVAALIGFVYLAGPSAIQWYVEEKMQEELDEALPPFSLVSPAGTAVQTADLRGKVVVVDFWATWCAPCIQSFPLLQQVYDRYADDERVAFLVVNTGEDLDTFTQFVNESEYTFPFVRDADNEASKALIKMGIPTLCIIDAEGRLRYRKTGLAPGYVENLTGKIESILAN